MQKLLKYAAKSRFLIYANNCSFVVWLKNSVFCWDLMWLWRLGLMLPVLIVFVASELIFLILHLLGIIVIVDLGWKWLVLLPAMMLVLDLIGCVFFLILNKLCKLGY